MYRLTSYATQRAPLAPVRALGLELLTTAFHSLCGPVYLFCGLLPSGEMRRLWSFAAEPCCVCRQGR